MRFHVDGRIVVAFAALIVVATPIWLLWPAPYISKPAAALPIVVPQAGADPTTLNGRQLFASNDDSAAPDDAPELAGIIGRPPIDAIALIRVADGQTQMVAPGQSFEGWRLEGVSAEAASFSRGSRHIRVPLPPSDPETAENPSNDQ